MQCTALARGDGLQDTQSGGSPMPGYLYTTIDRSTARRFDDYLHGAGGFPRIWGF